MKKQLHPMPYHPYLGALGAQVCTYCVVVAAVVHSAVGGFETRPEQTICDTDSNAARARLLNILARPA